MLRQVIEMRTDKKFSEHMKFQQIIEKTALSYVDEDNQIRFRRILTQKKFEEFVKHAEEVAKKWL